MRSRILESITNTFKEEYVPATYRKAADNPELPVDMVSIYYSEYGSDEGNIAGDFYFYNIPAAGDEVVYFSSVLTFTDELLPEKYAEMTEAISVINFMLPFGSFILNPANGEVVYRLVTPLMASLSEEELLNEVNILISNSLDIAEPFCGMIQKLADGRSDISEIRDYAESVLGAK